MTGNLTIDDLEKYSGLSTRTLHYYMSKGLLPGPETRGKYASYTKEHLDRLDLILILKEMHMPLKEIRAVLDRLTPSEIVQYRDDQGDLLKKLKATKPDQASHVKPRQQSSALDYIMSLEEAHTLNKNIAEDITTSYFKNESITFGIDSPAFTRHHEKSKSKQEIWRRIVLDEDIELNYRDTRDKATLYRIERLLAFARSLFENQEGSE